MLRIHVFTTAGFEPVTKSSKSPYLPKPRSRPRRVIGGASLADSGDGGFVPTAFNWSSQHTTKHG